MKKEKKTSVLMIITIAVFMLTLGGATYAYLRNQNYAKQTEGSIESMTNTTDSLSFNTSGDISIRANTENFEENMGNLSAMAVATATLLANNKTNISTMKYGLYININENNYEYSTTEKYPELLLQVIDPDGNEVTAINGLNYVVYKEEVRDAETDEVTQAKVAGFDVTTKKGMYILADNYSITVDEANTDHLTAQEWKVKVTLVNLDTDQEVNARKVFDTDVHIDKGPNFAEYLKTQVYGKDATLLLHNSSLANGAGDNSYRYSGASASVNNWVCFGSDTEVCSANNLYRIIGMFDDDKDGKYEIKLIKNTSIGTMTWGSNNIYSTSNVRSKVNGSYLSGLGRKWQDMIITHTWKVGGIDSSKGRDYSTAKIAYNYEVGPSSSSTTSKDKIGLMYVSDYYYATSSDYWTKKGSEYENVNVKGSNWMYTGLAEWTISRVTNLSNNLFFVWQNGYVTCEDEPRSSYAVRSSFYLSTNTYRISGTGTQSNPYRIA